MRARIGVTGQFSAVDDLLTGTENLRLMADLYHGSDRGGAAVGRRLLELFDLSEPRPKLAATYSGGMRRRLDLAMTLVGRPRIIFLDEPTTGLDPRSRRQLWQVIGDLVAGGVTIFLTTQYLEEADQLADRIAMLDNGRVVARGNSRRAEAAHPRRPRQPRRRLPRYHRHVRQGSRAMTTQTFPLRDSATMLRRNLRHLLRYPGMTISVVAMPVIFLLLFLYVLGGALRRGPRWRRPRPLHHLSWLRASSCSRSVPRRSRRRSRSIPT